MPPQAAFSMMGGPGCMPPIITSGPAPQAAAPSSAQILFARPSGMQIRWDVQAQGAFDSTPLVAPGRFNFPQGQIYRVKITNIPEREGVELYPTLELGPTTPRTAAYLAHNAIPVQFTDEDFDQVLSGNFVTKVIYLPDPEFQEYTVANPETLVSTRLDPGSDPVEEADRRGAIMAIIRIGNKDVEMPGAGPDTAHTLSSGVQASAPAMAPGFAPSYAGGPMAMNPMAMGPTGLSHPYISGVTMPEYGIPITGTPIGLPGPPHIPHGHPAGLQKHVIRNHTHMNIPDPVDSLKIHVRQRPGFNYPQPANRIRMTEQSFRPTLPFGRPSRPMFPGSNTRAPSPGRAS